MRVAADDGCVEHAVLTAEEGRPSRSNTGRGAVDVLHLVHQRRARRAGDHAQVDQFDPLDPVVMAVHALVLGLEAHRGLSERVSRRQSVEWDAQLRALSAVAQVEKSLEQHVFWRVAFAGQPRPCGTLEHLQTGEDDVRRCTRQLPATSLHELVARLGEQQTEGAE